MGTPQKIPFRETHSFTDFFLKYIEGDPSLKPYYSRFPSVENFKEAIKEKASTFPASSREVLVSSLQRQYSGIQSVPAPVTQSISSLANTSTFTITTGHQLSIFTGPLYFIYKIITVINAVRRLKKEYPDYNFVPVYWMASEDHDYEEIKSFRLYEKKYTWETKQKGAVGRFHTKDFESLLSQIPGDTSIFKDAYLKSKSLSEATRSFVTALFGEDGLVVIDADDRSLKAILEPVIRADLFQHTPSALVSETNKKLYAAGFTPQVNPREVNFFFLDGDIRSRLEEKDGDFTVVDTDLKFPKKEIEKMISNSPEKFSPNVILRPVYQELILPNLAYVGGPAELVYWLELKSTFDSFKVPFPILLPRNYALAINLSTAQKIDKTGLEVSEFFAEKNQLFNLWVTRNSSHDLSLAQEKKQVQTMLADIEKRCKGIDTTLTKMAKAEAARMAQALEKIEKKMLRAEKRLHEDRLRQIGTVKNALFPNGSLQERTDNFLNFYQQDPSFLKKLKEGFDPFDFRFNVLFI